MTIILMVEDHPMMRVAVRTVLEGIPEYRIAGEAGTVAEGRAMMEQLQPDLVLLDLYLPDGSGLELIRWRNEHQPAARILVMTSSSAEEDILESVEAGADSYVVKDSSPETLQQAIGSVLKGEAFLTPGAADILLRHIRREKPAVREEAALSDREIEVLQHMATGATNAEIADKLFITESTLRTHYQRLREKLGLANYNQLLVHAARHYTPPD